MTNLHTTTNNFFVSAVKNLKSHLFLNCEATTLVPIKERVEEAGCELGVNDWEDIFVQQDLERADMSNKLLDIEQTETIHNLVTYHGAFSRSNGVALSVDTQKRKNPRQEQECP